MRSGSKLFIILSLAFFISCNKNNDFTDNYIKSDDGISVLFSAHNSNVNVKKQEQPKPICDTVIYEDGYTITLSIEESGWETGYENIQTKTSWATTGGVTNWSSGDAIGIFMRRTDAVPDAAVDRSNVKYTTTSTTTSATFAPTTSTIRFPGNTSTKVDFMAYYPHETFGGTSSLVNFAAATDTTGYTALSYVIPANQTSSLLRTADLMSATKITNRDKTNTSVAFTFKHALTLMTFAIKSSDFTGVTLTKATLSGTKVTGNGTLNISTQNLTAGGTTFSPYTVLNQKLNSVNPVYADLIINPCTVTTQGTQMRLTLAIGNRNYTCNMPAMTYAAGTRYTANITINNTQGSNRLIYVYGSGTVSILETLLGNGDIGSFNVGSTLSATLTGNTNWVPYTVTTGTANPVVLSGTSPYVQSIPASSNNVWMQFRPSNWYPTSGLVSHFDGIYSGGFTITNTNASSNSTWTDISGYRKDMTLVNVKYDLTSGWLTNGIKLGPDDYMVYTGATVNNFTFNFVINIAPENQRANAQLVGWSAADLGFYLKGNPGDSNRKLAVRTSGDDGVIQSGSETGYAPVRNQIIQLTFTYTVSTATVMLYVNGVYVAKRTNVGSMLDKSNTRVGGDSNSSADLLANIHSYMVYNRVLTDTEIAAIYTFNQARFGMP